MSSKRCICLLIPQCRQIDAQGLFLGLPDIQHLEPIAGVQAANKLFSELLGLSWEQIDLEKNTITVNKQLSSPATRKKGLFITPKNGKSRTLKTAPSVIAALKDQRRRQAEMRLRAGQLWNNEYDLVFTLEDGSIYDQPRATREFKRLLAVAGLEGVRFHDLRHTYAVNAIRAGDDIKTIQGNLGHASAAFTLDRYGHFTEQMMQDSASRMENFIKSTLNL